ncbi:MAG: IPT/TIG domain-containing protein [Candidatus Methanoperedens sp.]|nr:IPT/TIG domain-containing protein [Candidatus Methanoperedens sp.]MCZ7369739.1 IPT/TIG domain-containing protein [Candidatus Methanoperedens sp.]
MKNKKLYLAAAVVFLAFVGLAWALTPPPPPPPPVPQNLGIFDTSIAFFQTNATDQNACRACHQTTGTNTPGGYGNVLGGVPTRHHRLLSGNAINPLTNAPFGCGDCHPPTPGVGNGILLDRSCTDCHNPANNFTGNSIGGHVGNLSRPHHFNTTYDDANIGNPVAARQCKICHGSFVANYNDSHYVPSYATDFMITPFATFKITSLQPLPTTLYHSDGTTLENKTWGGCESCHLGTVNASNNNSLAAKGLYTGTPILDNHDSHHQTILDGFVNVSGRYGTLGGRTPGAVCSWCHVIYPGETFTAINPFTGEILPSSLELRNSTIEAKDAANGSFEPGTVNITINGTGCQKCHSVQSIHNIELAGAGTTQGLGHVGNNTDCYGCHNSWLPADTNPFSGPIIPTVDSISPSVIAVNTATTLTITGSNFVNDAYTSVVTVDGVTYTPTSETDTQIVVSIPALSAGIHQLQLVKGPDTLSKLSVLTVVPVVTLSSATLNGATLTLSGSGFGSQPATNAQQYVIVGHAGYSASINSWSDTQIVATVSGTVAAGDTAEVITADAGDAAAAIVVSTPTPGITVTSPNGGETWKQKTTQTITWAKVGQMGANVKIEILLGTSVKKTISTANSGTYSWAIGTQALGTTYKVRITSVNAKGQTYTIYKDTSDSVFSIVKP